MVLSIYVSKYTCSSVNLSFFSLFFFFPPRTREIDHFLFLLAVDAKIMTKYKPKYSRFAYVQLKRKQFH